MSKLRDNMPLVADFLQSLIDGLAGEITIAQRDGSTVKREFTQSDMTEHIRHCMRGEIGFYASENGKVIGSPTEWNRFQSVGGADLVTMPKEAK